jgi:hypothetical protein
MSTKIVALSASLRVEEVENALRFDHRQAQKLLPVLELAKPFMNNCIRQIHDGNFLKSYR